LISGIASAPAHAGRGRQAFSASRHLEVVPDPGPCDVVITPANQAATLPMLNDSGKRVFCVDPGDYRAARHLELEVSGTATARRYLRYNAPFPAPPAIRQTSRAIFYGVLLDGASWWVIEGLTIQPTGTQDHSFMVGILGGSRNVLEGNLIDASLQVNYRDQSGVLLRESDAGAPSARNSIQNNVIRGGNKSRLAVDYAGVDIRRSFVAASFNDYTKVLDNEIYDWGHGVEVGASATCDDLGWARGTIIDGNDIYITAAKRVNCEDGTPDPNGECSCSEDGIDVKSPGGSRSDQWTQITNNRLWGFRPTLRAVKSCGGSGARGQAINSGNSCAAHVLVAQNAITDSAVGILTEGGQWRVAGNLLSEIRTADAAHGNQGIAIHPVSGTNSRVQLNTVVGVDNAYQDTAEYFTGQCNAVLHDLATKGSSGPRGAGHVVRYNHLYESNSPNNMSDSTTKVYAADVASGNVELCFSRKRWTAPEEVCVPFGHTTAESPHATFPTACNTDIGAAFGIPVITHP
jgi:hypothetical protein